MSIVDDYIRRKAQALGIDPNVALRVEHHEGGAFNPNQPDQGGDGHSSFGPFQLHYGGVNPAMPHPGMGDDFTKATGLDARNAATWPQQVDFALGRAAQSGWSPWMGAAAEGIHGMDGIGGRPSQALAASLAPGPTRERAQSQFGAVGLPAPNGSPTPQAATVTAPSPQPASPGQDLANVLGGLATGLTAPAPATQAPHQSVPSAFAPPPDTAALAQSLLAGTHGNLVLGQ